MDDLISRQAAIDAIKTSMYLVDAMEKIIKLPSAQPETSRIENVLHGKSAEEQYEFIWWLLQNYAMNFTDSRQAAIEWLKGEGNEHKD